MRMIRVCRAAGSRVPVSRYTISLLVSYTFPLLLGALENSLTASEAVAQLNSGGVPKKRPQIIVSFCGECRSKYDAGHHLVGAAGLLGLSSASGDEDWEWSAALCGEDAAATYNWNFAKVNDAYAARTMKMVILSMSEEGQAGHRQGVRCRGYF